MLLSKLLSLSRNAIIYVRHFTKKALKSRNCYTHAHTYRHTYAHIHTYMHTHMYTHTHISSSLQLFNSQYYTPPRLPYVLMEVCGDSGPLFYKGKISPPPHLQAQPKASSMVTHVLSLVSSPRSIRTLSWRRRKDARIPSTQCPSQRTSP